MVFIQCPVCLQHIECASRRVGLGPHIRTEHPMTAARMEERQAYDMRKVTVEEATSSTAIPMPTRVETETETAITCAVCGEIFCPQTTYSEIGRHAARCFTVYASCGRQRLPSNVELERDVLQPVTLPLPPRPKPRSNPLPPPYTFSYDDTRAPVPDAPQSVARQTCVARPTPVYDFTTDPSIDEATRELLRLLSLE